MKINVGPWDRLIRLIVGLVIVVVAIVFKSWWGLLGLAVMATGLFGYCGLYSLLKINTCKVK